MAIALSWSRVSDWQQCNRKFYLKYIEKSFPVEDASKSVHLVKGSEMHKQMENYTYAKINGKDPSQIGPASPACRDAFPIIDRVQANFTEIWPERQVAVTYDFKPTEWFGRDVAWRAIWDFTGVNPRTGVQRGHAIIIDWKTGKVQDYDDEVGQLHLAAAIAVPVLGVDDVDIFYAFLEHKVRKPDSPLRITAENDYPHIKAFFNKIYDRVNEEKEWAPQVNPYCNYCPATKSQCQFSRKV